MRRVACRRCGTVKRENLGFLADNPLYTKRFAFYVGLRCRSADIKQDFIRSSSAGVAPQVALQGVTPDHLLHTEPARTQTTGTPQV